MDIGREGHSGLYTMHFSNIFPPLAEAASEAERRKEAAAGSGSESQANGPCTVSSSPAHSAPCSMVQFTQWHVLIRMSVENDVCFVKGEAKVFSPTASLASPTARGIKANGEAVEHVTAPDGIPIVPVYQRDRKCGVLIEGTYRVPDDGVGGPDGSASTSFRLEVHFEKLEAELLGLREPAMLEDVTFRCAGYKACGWHMGVVDITVGGQPMKLDVPLRFLLKTYYGKRCTNCTDPVYAIGYTCDECETTQYCSRECLQAHMRRGHGLLCPLLKSRYSTRSGYVATEVSDDTGLIAWWRCLDKGYYSILVDSNNALGCAIEYTLCSLRSAKEQGLQYRLIQPRGAGASGDGKSAASAGSGAVAAAAAGAAGGAASAAAAAPAPTEEEVIDFSCVVFREVNRSAILDGCVPLSSACLDYLYVFDPAVEITIQSHVLFFTAFNCADLEGPITTVEEYVSYARTLHALTALQIEYALQSSVALDFWRRVKFAKDVAVSLVNVNTNKPCAPFAEMAPIVAVQRGESLVLLAKTFIIMATRAPPEEGKRWLEQAERSLRQCCDPSTLKDDPRTHAMMQFRLAAILLMFHDEGRKEEAQRLRALGTETLRKVRESSAAAKPQPKVESAAATDSPAGQQSGAEESEVKALQEAAK